MDSKRQTRLSNQAIELGVNAVMKLADDGLTVLSACRQVGLPRATYYKRLAENNKKARDVDKCAGQLNNSAQKHKRQSAELSECTCSHDQKESETQDEPKQTA